MMSDLILNCIKIQKIFFEFLNLFLKLQKLIFPFFIYTCTVGDYVNLCQSFKKINGHKKFKF